MSKQRRTMSDLQNLVEATNDELRYSMLAAWKLALKVRHQPNCGVNKPIMVGEHECTCGLWDLRMYLERFL